LNRVPRIERAAMPGLTGRGVRIAVVDSGVHATHPHVQGVAGGVAIDASGVVHDDYVDRLGHGTAVTAAIREKAPAAEIFAIKVFDRELATTGDALAAAISWALDHRVHLINLSLGTANADHESALQEAVDAAAQAGVQIVAAAPDRTTRWLPGALRGVVSVEGDAAMPRDECEMEEWSDGSTRIRASIYPRPIPGVPVERNLQGVSFAVANATGLLALLLERSTTPSR
jgi:subtilisin family serine protease